MITGHNDDVYPYRCTSCQEKHLKVNESLKIVWFRDGDRNFGPTSWSFLVRMAKDASAATRWTWISVAILLKKKVWRCRINGRCNHIWSLNRDWRVARGGWAGFSHRSARASKRAPSVNEEEMKFEETKKKQSQKSALQQVSLSFFILVRRKQPFNRPVFTCLRLKAAETRRAARQVCLSSCLCENERRGPKPNTFSRFTPSVSTDLQTQKIN